MVLQPYLGCKVEEIGSGVTAMDEVQATVQAEPKQPKFALPLAFFGSYDHSIDAKGRIIIPNAYRKALGDSFTLTVDPDSTGIAIYPDNAFMTMIEELYSLNRRKPAVQEQLKHIAKFSYPGMQADNQGRVLLPAKLRQYVLGDVRDVEISGALDYVRIVESGVGKREDEHYAEHSPEILSELGEIAD